jgi:hypothetical protein
MARDRGGAVREAGRGRLPDFLIIGAMRAGSTSLARYLAAHPGVFMPAKKELHYFDWNPERGDDWYRSQFAGATSSAKAGEATPIYIVYREAMERLAATCPEARLLAVLRNPVDRAYSHYMYNRMLGFEPLSFVDGLAAEDSRTTGVTDRRTFDYVARGRYLQQLERVCELYPRESLRVIIFEDLVRDPAGTYREVCRFLGVDETFEPSNLGERMNSHAEYRSKLLARVSRALPGPLARVTRQLNRRETRYAPMDPEVRRVLEERFAPDNEALAAWLGTDLPRWASSASDGPQARVARTE